MRGSSRLGAFANIVPFLLAASACQHEPKDAMPVTGSVDAVAPLSPSASVTDGGALGAQPLPLSPIDGRNALAGLYRPAPDRRFLRSLDEIERVVTGKVPAAAATARFDGGKWVVSIGTRELARFSEFPTFDEALAAATTRAQELAKGWNVSGPAALEAPSFPFDDQAFVTLAAAQEAWAKSPSRAALHDAARGLVAMALVASDKMDLSDELPARTLAVVALDKAFSAPTRSMECMLATAFGYRASAEKLAGSLSKSDPVRQYLLDEAALATAATPPTAPAWTRYLWERRLAVKGDWLGEAAFRRSAFPDGDLRLPILALRAEHADLAEQRELRGI